MDQGQKDKIMRKALMHHRQLFGSMEKEQKLGRTSIMGSPNRFSFSKRHTALGLINLYARGNAPPVMNGHRVVSLDASQSMMLNDSLSRTQYLSRFDNSSQVLNFSSNKRSILLSKFNTVTGNISAERSEKDTVQLENNFRSRIQTNNGLSIEDRYSKPVIMNSNRRRTPDDLGGLGNFNI